MNRRIPTLIATALVAVPLTACGGSSTSSSSPPPDGPVSTASTTSTTSPHASPRPAPLTVDTTSGRLHGITKDGVREFLGVRYAKPPTGSRRWTDPVPPAKPAGVVQATEPGASCAQAGSAPGASATASTSEDCLFLNVTTPRDTTPGEKLPVMVWWHGGGYTSGSGSAYDAQRLASRGHVMVVTVNYRLGVFGYLSLPGLAGSGDFGLADQLLATRWAKGNAQAFGGDPSDVTVFGESSGAMSACAALESPAARGLVDKVAMSSGGSCDLSWPRSGLVPGAPAQTPYLDVQDAASLGTTEAATLGCKGGAALACLRRLPVARLLKIFPVFSDVLAYDTPLLPQDPATAVAKGATLHVPVLSTGNRDEERAFVGGAQKVKPFLTTASYPTYLKQAFGSHAGTVGREYPLSRYPNAATAWSTVITDASWACPTLHGNAALAAHGSTVHGGEFDDPHAPDVNGVASKGFDPGAAHASDVPYLFDLVGKSLLRTPAQRTLSDRMIDYYTSFARTGTPSAAGAPDWPALTSTSGPSLQLRPGHVATVDVGAEHHCSFWSDLGSAH